MNYSEYITTAGTSTGPGNTGNDSKSTCLGTDETITGTQETSLPVVTGSNPGTGIGTDRNRDCDSFFSFSDSIDDLEQNISNFTWLPLRFWNLVSHFVSFTKLLFTVNKSDTDHDRDGDNESFFSVSDSIDNLEQNIVDLTLLPVRFFIHLPEHGSWYTVL
jgi:hypothetical protein